MDLQSYQSRQMIRRSLSRASQPQQGTLKHHAADVEGSQAVQQTLVSTIAEIRGAQFADLSVPQHQYCLTDSSSESVLFAELPQFIFRSASANELAHPLLIASKASSTMMSHGLY